MRNDAEISQIAGQKQFAAPRTILIQYVMTRSEAQMIDKDLSRRLYRLLAPAAPEPSGG